MVSDLLLSAHLAELHRRTSAAARVADARSGGSRPATAGTRGRARPAAGHAPGVWCWLLDRLPARAQQHAAA